MTTGDKTIKVPASLHGEIDEMAWDRRTTKAGVARAAIEIIATTKYPPAPEPERQVVLKIRGVDNELWQRAVTAAHDAGITMAEALAGAVKVISEDGFQRGV